MYVAGQPGLPGEGGARPLCIGRAARRVFAGESAEALHPGLRVFMADLARPYGLGAREDTLAGGAGQSYGEMGAALLASVLAPGEPLDLLVLAFAMPDVRPERSTASYLSHLCPGEPMAFAVCDQGTAAAFTGLRLIGEYARSDGCERALLLVIEQAVLHHDLPAANGTANGTAAGVPARHAAVALTFGRAGPARVLRVRQHAAVAPERAGPLLAAGIAELAGAELAGAGPAATGPGVTLVLGRDLARLARLDQLGVAGPVAATAGVRGLEGVSRVRVAPDGQPCTGVWWELAGDAGGRAGPGFVLLADYDQALRYLSLSAIEVS